RRSVMRASFYERHRVTQGGALSGAGGNLGVRAKNSSPPRLLTS
ncbi:hypothetical protein A2U01_0076815, partial [Trifolium medium]|nr:hypothetical protein [Trifolium medium]